MTAYELIRDNTTGDVFAVHLNADGIPDRISDALSYHEWQSDTFDVPSVECENEWNGQPSSYTVLLDSADPLYDYRFW